MRQATQQTGDAAARVPTISLEPMTVEDFFEFADGRPDDEKWELIDGCPRMNAAPSPLHQLIVGNVIVYLGQALRALGNPYFVIPGIGVRVSDNKLPVPDVMVSPLSDFEARDCTDAIAVFEILSPSTRRMDLQWKRTAYPAVAAIQHYVVIAQSSIDISVFDRAGGFAKRRITAREGVLDLPACGLTIPVAEIYRHTGLV